MMDFDTLISRVSRTRESGPRPRPICSLLVGNAGNYLKMACCHVCDCEFSSFRPRRVGEGRGASGEFHRLRFSHQSLRQSGVRERRQTTADRSGTETTRDTRIFTHRPLFHVSVSALYVTATKSDPARSRLRFRPLSAVVARASEGRKEASSASPSASRLRPPSPSFA